MDSFLRYVGLPIAIICGIFLPYGKDLGSLVLPILIVLLYSSYLKINFQTQKIALKTITLIILSTILIALMTFFISKQIFEDQNWIIGLTLIAIAPAAISSTVVVNYLKGNIPLSLQLVLATNLLSIIYIPTTFYLLFHAKLSLDLPVIGEKLFIGLILPLILAVITKQLKLDSKISPVINKLSFPLLCITIWIVFSQNVSSLAENSLKQSIYAISLFALAIVNFSIGYLLSKKDRSTTSISLGYKNTVLTIWIALTFFSKEVALIPTIYIICHHIINSIFIMYSSKDRLEGREP